MINKYFQHHKVDQIQLAQNIMGISMHALIFILPWIGDWPYEFRLLSSSKQNVYFSWYIFNRESLFCQVSASWCYILLSSIMMWLHPMMKCLLNAGNLGNKCSSGAQEVTGLKTRINANQTFASVIFSALRAVSAWALEACPAVFMLPCLVEIFNSFFFLLSYLFPYTKSV